MRRCGLPACAMALRMKLDAAALPRGIQHAIGRGLQPLMRVWDHQLGLGLAGADCHAEHFAAAVAVHADRDDDRQI